MHAWYALHPQQQSFAWYVQWHFVHGFVFATPEFFIMGRHVRKDAGEQAVCEPTSLFSKDESDTWYLHAASGDMQKAWSILPWALPWIAFERTRGGKRELQIFATDRLRELCGAETSPP